MGKRTLAKTTLAHTNRSTRSTTQLKNCMMVKLNATYIIYFNRTITKIFTSHVLPLIVSIAGSCVLLSFRQMAPYACIFFLHIFHTARWRQQLNICAQIFPIHFLNHNIRRQQQSTQPSRPQRKPKTPLKNRIVYIAGNGHGSPSPRIDTVLKRRAYRRPTLTLTTTIDRTKRRRATSEPTLTIN